MSDIISITILVALIGGGFLLIWVPILYVLYLVAEWLLVGRWKEKRRREQELQKFQETWDAQLKVLEEQERNAKRP